jgi:hypothetical protein
VRDTAEIRVRAGFAGFRRALIRIAPRSKRPCDGAEPGAIGMKGRREADFRHVAAEA